MKRKVSLLLILIISVMLVFSGCSEYEILNYKINNDGKINIGVLLPLSGELSEIGNDVLEGVEYAAEIAPSVNLEDNYNIELIIKDINSSIEESAQMMLEENVAAVICCGGSTQYSDEVLLAFENTTLPLIFTDNYASVSKDLSKVFSLNIPVDYQVSSLISYIDSKGYAKGAFVCADDSEFCTIYADLFEKTASTSVVSATKYYYAGEEQNFSAKSIAAINNEFVFIIGNYTETVDICKELREGGFEGEIIATESFDKTLFESENYNDFTFLSKFEPDDNNYIGTDFLNVYSDKKDESINNVSAATVYGYDAYMMIYDALSSFHTASQSPLFSATEATDNSEENTDILTSQVTDKIKTINHMGVSDMISFKDNGSMKTNFLYIDTIENSNAVMISRYNYNNAQN